jgi:hypothetical protein
MLPRPIRSEPEYERMRLPSLVENEYRSPTGPTNDK